MPSKYTIAGGNVFDEYGQIVGKVNRSGKIVMYSQSTSDTIDQAAKKSPVLLEENLLTKAKRFSADGDVIGSPIYTGCIPCPASVVGTNNIYETVLATIVIPKDVLHKNSAIIVQHHWFVKTDGANKTRLCTQLVERNAEGAETRFYNIDTGVNSGTYSARSEIVFLGSKFRQSSGQHYSTDGMGYTGTSAPMFSQYDFENNDLEIVFTGETLSATNSVTLLGATATVI